MSDLKPLARTIFEQTLDAVDARRAVRATIAREGKRLLIGDTEIEIGQAAELRVVAFGRAACAMAEGLAEVLEPDFPMEGILAAPSPPPRRIRGLQFFLAGHPAPNEGSFAAARAILDLLVKTDERTTVFFLLSGGGSSLVELPLDSGVSLEEMRELQRTLVNCGGSVDEINVVRKHISAVKGGRMAAAAPAAVKFTLAISDVPPGREFALASGPTLPDSSRVEDAYQVAERYGVTEQLSGALRNCFERRTLRETPKEGDPAFERSQFFLLLDQHKLFHQAHRAAESHGLETICDNSTDNWPLERASDFLLGLLDQHKQANPGLPVAVIADGEVLCRMNGNGLGGRNSAFALYMAQKIEGRPVAMLSAATDGIDGSSPAAGAIADGTTIGRERVAGFDAADFFRRSDSYSFFARLGDAILTGPTGNNLRDLRILIQE